MATRRGPVSSTAVLLAGLVGLIGYVAGLATSRPSTPLPSASAVAAAPSGASHTPATGSIPGSREPSHAPSTPEPLAWAWERTLFLPDQYYMVDGVWSVGDRILGLASYYNSWYVPRLDNREFWPWPSTPPGIEYFRGGTVADDRLWFLAYVPGFRPGEESLRLLGTNADENERWTAMDPSDLDPDEPIRFLGKIQDTWVVAYIGEGGNIEIGSPQYLATSKDGVHWSAARVPGLQGVDPFDVAFGEGAATDDFIVVPMAVERSGTAEMVFLVSRDGEKWREVVPPEQFDYSSDLACSDNACVLTRFAFEDTPLPYPLPIAWVSSDGVTWTESETRLVDENAGPGIRYVAATNDGFVGIEGVRSNVAWVSSADGLRWRRYEVLPEKVQYPLVEVAVSGDIVVGLEQGPDVEPQGAWVGSLAGLRPD